MSWPGAGWDLNGADTPPVSRPLPILHTGAWFEPFALGLVGEEIPAEVDTFHISQVHVRHIAGTVQVTLTQPEVYGVALLDSFAFIFGAECSLVLTLYDEDRITALWNVGTAQDHARPYLVEPDSYGEQEVDFAKGAASLGTVTVTVIDPRTIAGDQDSGWMTARLAELGVPNIHGKRARLTRFISEDLGEVVIADGPASNVRLDSSYAGFSFAIRDTRETERKIRAFDAGGERTLLPPRSLVLGYGYNPVDLTDLLDPATPLLGRFHRGGTGFQVNSTNDPASSGYIDLTAVPGNLASRRTVSADDIAFLDRLSSDQDHTGGRLVADGPPQIWEVDRASAGPVAGRESDQAYVRWRAAGSFDPWIELPLMIRVLVDPPWIPAAHFDLPFQTSYYEANYPGGFHPGDPGEITKLYFGDLASTPLIPADNEDIEIVLVLRGSASDDHPAHIDGYIGDGYTAGQFIRDVYDGLYSAPGEDGGPVPSDVRYDVGAVLAITEPIRLRLFDPIDDMRDWLESHIYAPLGYAPALDSDGKVSPIYQGPPSDIASLPAVDNVVTEPSADWDSGQRIINVVRVSYFRDYIPVDPDNAETGDGLADKDIVIEFADEVSVRRHGRQVVDIDASAFRTLGTNIGDPLTAAGINGERTYEIARDRKTLLLDRYSLGCPAFTVAVRRDAIPLVRAGDWVVVSLSWLPDYVTGKRGLLCLGQAISIGDLDCAWRRLLLEQVVPLDITS